MASSGASSRAPMHSLTPIDEARRLYRSAEEREAHHDRARYADALKAFLAFVEGNRRRLSDDAAEVAGRLDEAAMAFYRLSLPDLARRAAEVGLALAPGSAGLLYHKALILIALNEPPKEILELLDRAERAKPNDKGIWATRGDILRLAGNVEDAVAAYLKAQELDPTTTRYVDRALKLNPKDLASLRAKVRVARSHGADRTALEACDALLAITPDDVELHVARIELLTGLGELTAALEAVQHLRARGLTSMRLSFLAGRLLLALNRTDEAIQEFQTLFAGAELVDATVSREVAERLDAAGVAPELALTARLRLKVLEPRNLANLAGIRALAVKLGRADVGIDACRTILAASPENLDAMRGLAELLLASGNPDEGFEAFRALVHAHPNDVGEIHRALDAAAKAGRQELVSEFAKAIVAADPKDRKASEHLARSLAETGSDEDALKIIDELISRNPDDVTYWLEKRRLLIQLGRRDDLPAVYDELFRLDPTRSDIAIERGNLYLTLAFDTPEGSEVREKSARAALVAYERASLDPELATASQLGVARASRLVKDPTRAITAYRALLEGGGSVKRDDLLKELGHALREVGKPADAEAAYSQALELGREDPDLLWGEVQVLSQLNQEARALRYLDLLVSREPTNPMFLRRKGQLLLKTGRRADGLAALKSAVDSAGSDPHAHFEVGEALRAQGAYADAVGYFQQGLALDPNSRPGRLALAETLLLAGRYNEVIPQVDQLLREDPNDLGAWRARADAYRALNRPQEVLYSLKAVLLLDPHNGPALQEKYQLHAAAGEPNDAFEAVTQLLGSGGTESQDPALWIAHGDLASELGRIEDANRSYERATTLDPTQAMEIAARRARARLVAGRPDLALEALDSAVGQSPSTATSVAALTLRAEILTALERPQEAKAVFEQVRAREPGSATAVAGIARSMLDQGQHAAARDFLRNSLPSVTPEPKLFLLLAEAESGLGAIPEAVRAIRQGVEVVPKSVELWTRLGELNVAREQWGDAATSFAHAVAIDGNRADLQLKAGFVAEKLGHPNEALALYDQATQIAPSDKYGWVSRGLVLLSMARSEDAMVSFDRALALDSDFESAKEGKKAASQKAREGLIDKYGREALLLEARLHRPITKNDLFVTLHVPYELLEPILGAVSRSPKVNLDRLAETEVKDLESASYVLITTALERRPEGIERRGFTLADVAVLSPPTYSLEAIQRLFGYLKSVLEADLRPENLKLSPDVEELARKALLLPEGQRTLFQIVKTLKVGLYKARLIKAVEAAGAAVHAPLPTLNLGDYSPEFQGSGGEVQERDGVAFFAPAGTAPTAPAAPTAPTQVVALTAPSGSSALIVESGARCIGCGGIASVRHTCGATLCQVCIGQFPTCPKCRLPVDMGSRRPIATSGPDGVVADHARAASHGGKPAPPKPRGSVDRIPDTSHHPAALAAPQARPKPTATPSPPQAGAAKISAPAEPAAVKPVRPVTREKGDDEPRL